MAAVGPGPLRGLPLEHKMRWGLSTKRMRLLWIQNQMLDYGFNFMNTKIFIDNESTICIVKNPVFYSKTKHIEIRHHFIRDCYEKKLIQVIKINTDHNVADLLTKAFDVSSTAGISLELQLLSKFEELFEGRSIENKYETIYKEWEDRMERAATTASSLDAEQDSGSGPRCQDTILGGVDAQTRFETASKQSNDPPLSRGYTLGSGEDEKPTESDGFHEIIDFLNANQIYYALTVNPTIYTPCIEKFWAITKVKTVNRERQIQALVDKKKVIITESSIRSDLHLEDTDGTDCFPTATIFEELARMGRKQKKTTVVPHPSDSTTDVPNEESVHTHSNDPLLSVFAENDMIEKDQDVIPKEVSTAAPFTIAVSPPVITEVEITLAQTLAKLNSAKSKVMIQEPVQSTTTIAPSIIPKAKGITFRDVGESTTRTPTSVSFSSIKDKGKAKTDELEVPLNKKDQIDLDEEMARNLEAQIQADSLKKNRLYMGNKNGSHHSFD
ncbi:hypothetical protein Tco_1484644 [Tanacetum coccineum]